VYLCMSVSSLASLSLCSSFKSSSASLPIFAANRFVCQIGKCVNNNNVCTQLVMLDKT